MTDNPYFDAFIIFGWAAHLFAAVVGWITILGWI